MKVKFYFKFCILLAFKVFFVVICNGQTTRRFGQIKETYNLSTLIPPQLKSVINSESLELSSAYLNHKVQPVFFFPELINNYLYVFYPLNKNHLIDSFYIETISNDYVEQYIFSIIIKSDTLYALNKYRLYGGPKNNIRLLLENENKHTKIDIKGENHLILYSCSNCHPLDCVTPCGFSVYELHHLNERQTLHIPLNNMVFSSYASNYLTFNKTHAVAADPTLKKLYVYNLNTKTEFSYNFPHLKKWDSLQNNLLPFYSGMDVEDYKEILIKLRPYVDGKIDRIQKVYFINDSTIIVSRINKKNWKKIREVDFLVLRNQTLIFKETRKIKIKRFFITEKTKFNFLPYSPNLIIDTEDKKAYMYDMKTPRIFIFGIRPLFMARAIRNILRDKPQYSLYCFNVNYN